MASPNTELVGRIRAEAKKWADRQLAKPKGLGEDLSFSLPKFRLGAEGVTAQLRFNYGANVRYDAERGVYELIERFGTTPGLSFATLTEALGKQIGLELSVSRSHELVVTRGGFEDVRSALRAIPYPLHEFPATAEEAYRMKPGDRVALPVGSAIGLRVSLGETLPLSVDASASGVVRLEGRFHLIIERLLQPATDESDPAAGQREFRIQILVGTRKEGGAGARIAVDAPVVPTITILDYQRKLSKDRYGIFSSGPVSLRSEAAAGLYRDFIRAQFHFPDTRLLMKELTDMDDIRTIVFAREIPEDELALQLADITKIEGLREKIAQLPELVRWHKAVVETTGRERTLPLLIANRKFAHTASLADISDFQDELVRYGRAGSKKTRERNPLGVRLFERVGAETYSIWNGTKSRLLTLVEREVIDRHVHPSELVDYLSMVEDLIPPNYRQYGPHDSYKLHRYAPGEDVPPRDRARCADGASFPDFGRWVWRVDDEAWEMSVFVRLTFPEGFFEGAAPDMMSGTPTDWIDFQKHLRRRAAEAEPLQALTGGETIRPEVTYRIDLAPRDKGSGLPKRSYEGRIGKCLKEADFLIHRWHDIVDPYERR